MSLPPNTLLPTFIKVTIRVGSTRADINIHITLSSHLTGHPILSVTTDLNPCLPGLELSVQMAILLGGGGEVHESSQIKRKPLSSAI